MAEEPPLSSSSVVGHVSVFVPMKGLIDPKAGIRSFAKDLDKVQKQHDQIANKLSNEGFVMRKHQQPLLRVKRLYGNFGCKNF